MTNTVHKIIRFLRKNLTNSSYNEALSAVNEKVGSGLEAGEPVIAFYQSGDTKGVVMGISDGTNSGNGFTFHNAEIIESKLSTKVDKTAGQGLSTNDYSDDEKKKVNSSIKSISTTGASNSSVTTFTKNDSSTIKNTISGNGVTVSVTGTNGEYITTLSVASATTDTIGGIKVGYAENGKNYPVLLDSSSEKAYVNVPWENNTHYASNSILADSNTATANTTTTLANGKVRINHIENGKVTSSALIKGTGSTIVTASTDGTITISSSTPDLSTYATQTWVTDKGYTTNKGTVTSVAVKMNGATKGTITSSGTIDLGNVITAHQSITGKSDTTHTHKIKINGSEKTIAASTGSAVDLGTYAVSNTLTNENLNNVTTPGFYNAGGGNTCTNKPSGVEHFGLTVIHNASGTYYTQMLTNDTKTYGRTCVNGTWNSWVELKYTDTHCGYCNTASATAAKVVYYPNYVARTDNVFVLTLANANTYAGQITLNVNSTGAKNVVLNGGTMSSSLYSIPAGNYLVYYDGTNYHINNNSTIPITVTSANSASKVTSSLSWSGYNTGSYDGSSAKTITIPSNTNQLTNGAGFTTNKGTVTSVAVKMNGATKGTITSSGTIDLGTVITAHQDISGKADTGHTHATSIAVSTGDTNISLGHGYKYQLAAGGTSTIFAMPSETTLSAVTSGDGNAFTSVAVDGHKITLTKDSSFSLNGHTHKYAGSSSAGGAANSANKLTTGRSIKLTGSVTGSVTFDGSKDVEISTTTNHTHTKSQISDFPTSLPANGGNADTLDNKHATDFASSSHTHATTITGTTNTANITFEHGKNYQITAGGTSTVFTMPSETTLSKGTTSGGGNAVTDISVNGHTVTLTKGATYIPSSEKGAASGVVPLNANSKIDSTYLPSYVDDVLEYSGKTNFPTTGETGKIYVDIATNLTYRWGGSAYVEISPSLALGTTSSTAFAGDKGQTAYSHSQITSGNPHKVTKSDVGLGNVDNTADANKSVKYATTAGSANAVAWGNVTGKPSTFTPASHTHEYLPLSGGTLSGDVIFKDSKVVQLNTLKVPTAAGGSTYGAGTNGQVLKTNGTTVYWGSDNNTHYESKTVVANSTTSSAETTANLGNGQVYLNHVENNGVKTTHLISGDGATTVSATTDGTIIIHSTDTNTVYTHPTTSGNKHIPSGGSSGQILRWSSDGTATWGSDNNTDTKNTAGSTDTSSKIFLIGATSQAANPQTYSHDTCYVGTDGCLYSNNTKVITSIPTATTSSLGTVKVGSNITVNSGTISVSKSNVTTALGYTPSNVITIIDLT